MIGDVLVEPRNESELTMVDGLLSNYLINESQDCQGNFSFAMLHLISVCIQPNILAGVEMF